jgi:hypothetical protein
VETAFTGDFEAFWDHLRETRHSGRVLVEIAVHEGVVRRVDYFEKRVIDPHKRET